MTYATGRTYYDADSHIMRAYLRSSLRACER